MLRIKLEALEHPTPNEVNINDRQIFASTVLWLEDQKIRTYPIEDRSGLRKINELDDWELAYAQYKKDLGMPQFRTPIEEMSWILSYAVRLEFLDGPENFKHINAKNISEQNEISVIPSIKAANVYDNMDFNHKDFISGVRALATKLKIAHHPNHLIQLEAIARLVNQRALVSREAITGTPFPFEIGNDVMCEGEDAAALDYPARILRLLQIQSLRELQTRINETIVSVQNLTANPKTDTKLGQVGR